MTLKNQSLVRRQASVLFVDLVDSTRISRDIGIDVFHEKMSGLLADFTQVIEEQGGQVARYTGDGLLAYFGYERSRELQSYCAVKAAIKMRDIAAQKYAFGTEVAALRCGIATGQIITGDEIGGGGALEQVIFGDIPNLAARLQSAAKPGDILLCETTKTLCRNFIDVAPIRYLRLKGIERPVPSYAVNSLTTGFLDTASNHQTFVGRTVELETIRQAVSTKEIDAGHAFIITGPAGIGKTALIGELIATSPAGSSYLQVAASIEDQNVPFGLASKIFDAANSRPGTLLGGVAEFDQSSSGSEFAAELAQSIGKFLKNSQKVLVVEDVHWADPLSQEFLRQLCLQRDTHSPTTIFSSRYGLTDVGVASEIELKPLEEGEAIKLVSSVLTDAKLPHEVSEICNRAQGNPLYLCELTKWSSKSDSRDRKRELPGSIASLLQERLDEIPGALPALQAIAILSADADFRNVVELSQWSQIEVAEALIQSQKNGLIGSHASLDSNRICFSHALLEDAVISSLPKQDATVLRRRAAKILLRDDATFGRKVRASHLLAEAEYPAEALEVLRSLARHALNSQQYLLSKSVAEQAIGLLPKVGHSAGRDRIELDIQTTLASARQITDGYSAVGAEQATKRAERLAKRLGDIEKSFAHASGKWMALSSSGRFSQAATQADLVMRFAKSDGRARSLASAWMMRLTAQCRIGNFQEAEKAFQNGASFFSDTSFLEVPGATAQTWGNAAIVALLTGSAAIGRQRAAVALRGGLSSARPYDQAFARYMVAMFAVMQGDYPAGKRLAKSALEISERENFPQFVATSQVVLGRANASLENPRTAAERIQSGLAAMENSASSVGKSMYLTWLAEAELFAGKPENSLAALDTAIEQNPEEKFYRPESLRLRALVSAQIGDAKRSAEDLKDAIALAESMGGRFFLSRLATVGANPSAC